MRRKRKRKNRREAGMRMVFAAVLILAAALSVCLAGRSSFDAQKAVQEGGNALRASLDAQEEVQEGGKGDGQTGEQADEETEATRSLAEENDEGQRRAQEQGDTEARAAQGASENTGSDTKTTDVFAPEHTAETILSLSAGEVVSAGMVEGSLLGQLFFSSELNDEIFARMEGISYTQNEFIQRSDLSYLRMLYWDGQNTCVGEMVVNKNIEQEVLAIFRTLYEEKYPIEKMVLIDNYGGDDEASMQDNNTSAFNFRKIAGSDKLSNHSYGMAIDLNPKYNPYVKVRGDGSIVCQPLGSEGYADRMGEFAYKIDENDLAFQLFTQAGFTWGGSWNSVKDYQHFEWER